MSFRSSPHTDRISKISEKLNLIQHSTEAEKSTKLEQSEHRVKLLEDNFNEVLLYYIFFLLKKYLYKY